MSDLAVNVGDRVFYRSSMGVDMPGKIVRLDGDFADIELDGVSGPVRNVERNPGKDPEAIVAVSWRPAPPAFEPPSDMGGIWTEALCAGLVMMLSDAADGVYPLDNVAVTVPAALRSFRRGVALVVEVQRENPNGESASIRG